MGLVFLAPVAHEPVELLQRGFVIAAVALEGDGDVFVGMDVMEGKRAGVAFGDGVLQGIIGAQQQQPGHAEPCTGACQGQNERELAPRANRQCNHPRIVRPNAAPPKAIGSGSDDHAVLSGRVNVYLAVAPRPPVRYRPKMAKNGPTGGEDGARNGTRRGGHRPGRAAGHDAPCVRPLRQMRSNDPNAFFVSRRSTRRRVSWLASAVASLCLAPAAALRRRRDGGRRAEWPQCAHQSRRCRRERQLAGIVHEGGLIGEVHHRPVDEIEAALVAAEQAR